MMRMMSNKHNVRIVSIIVAIIFVVGIGALAYTQMATPGVSDSGNSSVGIVDPSKIQSAENPLHVAAGKEYQEYSQKLIQEAQAKMAAAADDQAKAQIKQETDAALEAKEAELMKNLTDKTDEAAKAVGEAKGLSVVMSKGAVVYGGVDITDQVLHKLTSEASANK